MAETVSAAIEIDAPPEHVWAVLSDLAGYPQWHPVFTEVSGQLTAGNKISLTSTQPQTGRTMTAKVKVLTAEPDTELRWTSKMLGLPISERIFRLSPTGDGTSVEQAGTYRGLGASRARNTVKTIERIQDTYAAINQAIKQPAEARQRAAG